MRFLLYVWTCLFFVSFAYAGDSPVVVSSKSVFRVMSAEKISQDILPQEVQERLRRDGRVVLSAEGKKGIVFVHNNEFYQKRSHGTGFVINDTQMLTNHHVVGDVINFSSIKGFIVIGDGNPLDLREFSVNWFDEDKDLAVLDVTGVNAKPLVLSTSMNQNEVVTSIGFPGVSDDASGANDTLNYFTAKTRSGSYSAPSQTNGFNYLEHSAPISPGNSGGPLVNLCGEVLGVNTFEHTEDNNTLYALSTKEVVQSLKAQGIKFTQTTSECVPPQGFPDWVKFLLVGLLVLVVAIIAFIVHIKMELNKGKKPKFSNKLLDSIVTSVSKDNLGKEDYKLQVDSHGREFWDFPVYGIVYKDQLQVDSHGREFWYDSVYGIVYMDQVSEKPEPKPKPESNDQAVIVRLLFDGKLIDQEELSLGSRIVVGADRQSVHLFIDQEYVSSKHLAVEVNKKGVFVENLSEKNSSYIGRKRIEKTKINQSTTVDLVDESLNIQVQIDLHDDESDAQEKVILKSVGKTALSSIHLTIGKRVLIGRANKSDIIYDEQFDNSVSEKHCYVRAIDQNTVIVEDNDSTNGVSVDALSNKVDKVEITKGQVVYLASEEFAYKFI